MELDFEIDKITESIENVQTGEVLKTLVMPVEETDLHDINKKMDGCLTGKMSFLNPNGKCLN